MGKKVGSEPERRRKQASLDVEQEQTRNQHWPGSSEWIWDLNNRAVKGFATMPRLIPLILVLIRQLAGKGSDPTGVYLELWCRDRGQGLVKILHESDHAYAAGYAKQRGIRTWKFHMRTLRDLGFIKTKPRGRDEFGHVLLLDPIAVAHWYKEQGKTTEAWWVAFTDRANEIGAVIPRALNPSAPPAALPASPEEIASGSPDLIDPADPLWRMVICDGTDEASE